ncbi:DUF3500 domain-containing protein [Amycolatopsis jejuensis]|uniref:DUF3500 domain-containing protein n=1 Tax=Amycolatopsis jejuensis TaxID=330084 RepID=UPI00068EF2AC|nr:DUF3500 domain-containing protein [Amycolatopsis jejuensis]
MARVAAEFLDSLPPELHVRARLAPLGDPAVDAERRRWFYTPTDHGGVPLRELSPRQQSLAMQLLATGLTRPAYVTASIVLGLENVLDELEGWQVTWGRERGRDPGLYWIRVFGDPGAPDWGWRVGGHHLSINVLVRGGRIAATTPSFLGADPAASPLLAGTLRPLGGIEDVARDLMRSLPPSAQAQALLHDRAAPDIVSGNRSQIHPGDRVIPLADLFRGPLPTAELRARIDRMDAAGRAKFTERDHAVMAITAEPPGISARDLTAEQRAFLRILLAGYTDRAPQPIADHHRRHYLDDRHLDAVHFAWAGSTAKGEPHYYRLTGPDLFAEYDNTQRDANHAHSVWRNPNGDFGPDPLNAHRTAAHGG